MISKVLEILRWVGCGFGFMFAYNYYYAGDVVEAIHVLTPWLVGSVAGLTGIGAIFFYKQGAKALGWKKQTAYHKEVGYFCLSCAFVALGVFFASWGLQAELTILFTFSLFIVMSAINHTYEKIMKKNYSWQNFIRPFATILWVVMLGHLVVSAMMI